MEQNEAYYFAFEPEILNALGEKRVGQIKHYHLERLFDDLYDYYFQYADDEDKKIQEAYDMIFNFSLKVVREYIINDVLSKYAYGDNKAVQSVDYHEDEGGFIYTDTDSIHCESEDKKR